MMTGGPKAKPPWKPGRLGSSTHHLVSNSERGKPDCLMIPDNVPILNSSWSGTGTVIVVFPSSFCMMMWLPFRRTSIKPCLDMILQTSLPERTRNLGTFQPRCLSNSDSRHRRQERYNVGLFLQPASNL